MAKSGKLPTVELPKCRWRGRVEGDECVCRSPKLIGRLVALTVCTGEAWSPKRDACKYVDHEPEKGKRKIRVVKKGKFENCQHRGELLRQETCKVGCKKGTLFEVFQCAVFGECSLHKRNHGIAACAGCEEFKEK